MRVAKREATPTEQETLDLEPLCDMAMSLCLECWKELESERPIGGHFVGPIPRRAIREWCADEGVDSELTSILVRAIRYLDARRAERLQDEINR